MLRWNIKERVERGDTLIEVVFALAILSFVLVGSTLLAAQAFQLGQLARERTQVANDAQSQMEALRSFRDNHVGEWDQFRNGSAPSCTGAGQYCGIDSPHTQGSGCFSVSPCFHMADVTVGADTEWVPEPGPVAGSIGSSEIEISTTTPAAARDCGYDFSVYYSFIPLGSSSTAPRAFSSIQTRLVNLSFTPPAVGSPVCP